MLTIEEKVQEENISILYENLSPGLRGSVFQKQGRWFIIVNRNDPFERQRFTIAHEYFEIQLYARSDLSPDEKHNFANKLASEFLLPKEEFEQVVHTKDIHELKKDFPHVSYEVIARRIPSFRSVIVSIMDNMKVTCRFGPPGVNFPRTITHDEMAVGRKAYKSKSTAMDSKPPLKITAYYLEKVNHIERVFIVSEIDEYVDV